MTYSGAIATFGETLEGRDIGKDGAFDEAEFRHQSGKDHSEQRPDQKSEHGCEQRVAEMEPEARPSERTIPKTRAERAQHGARIGENISRDVKAANQDLP